MRDRKAARIWKAALAAVAAGALVAHGNPVQPITRNTDVAVISAAKLGDAAARFVGRRLEV
ncbi:hypothetical protein EAH79_05520 [Sphingomonas koreensis]|nr:hypothetical protein EAH87_12930 [Sphingomonas koreensis]TPG43250.1 hypothetical protein EAH79_05520 [Sphingomonas koreensis]